MNQLTTNVRISDAPEGKGAQLFCVTSLIFLSLAALMLAGRSTFLLTPVLTGHGLSWISLLFYGAGLSGIFGVIYWALPMVYRIPLYSEKFVFLHYGFHLAGTILILLYVLVPGLHQAAMGQTFIACGALIFVLNLNGTFRSLTRPDASSAFLSATALWLLVIAFLGVPFAKEAPLPMLIGTQWSIAWLVFSLSGVFLNGLMGLALKVTPPSLGNDSFHTTSAWYALAFTNGGLAWMFAATAFGPFSFLIFCAGVYLLGVIIYLAVFFSMVQQRISYWLPWDAKILIATFSLIPIAVALLILDAWQRIVPPVVAAASAVTPALPEPMKADPTTGPLPLDFLPIDGAILLIVLLGVALPACIGLLFQLIRLQNGFIGKGNANELSVSLSEQILMASFFNYATGFLMLIPGMWVGIEKIVNLGSLFLLVGSLGFLGNYFYSQRTVSLATSPNKSDTNVDFTTSCAE